MTPVLRELIKLLAAAAIDDYLQDLDRADEGPEPMTEYRGHHDAQ